MTVLYGSNGQPLKQGTDNELLVTPRHGEYYHVTKSGKVFHGATAAAGVLIPVSTTTGPTFGILNPIGSGVDVVLHRFSAGFVSTTGAAGNIEYAYKTGVGGGAATGAVVTALTPGTPSNGYIGGGVVSKVIFFPATATLASGGSIFRPMGVSQLVTTATTTSQMYSAIVEDFRDDVIIPPGVIFYIVGSAALLSLYNLALTWREEPV